jgi:hypothetical protein
VERIFAVLKRRFAILQKAIAYPYDVQANVVVALAVLHNIIRLNGGARDYWERNAVVQDVNDSQDTFEQDIGSVEYQSASERRDAIAEQMWRDYQRKD